jgi:ribosomal protein S18 acetylase RimI-like enzyme
MRDVPRSTPGAGSAPAEVRRIRAAEAPALRNLRLAALASDPLAFGSEVARETAFPPEHWIERASEGAEDPEHPVWVAEIAAGTLVGMIGAFPDAGRFHLWGMWVAPELRGHRLGARLLDAALQWIAAQHPSSEVLLDVNPSQEAALRLYQRRGFVATGRTEPLPHRPEILTVELRRPASVAVSPGSATGTEIP